MKVQYKKLSKIATFDAATDGSAGYDLTACTVQDDGTHITVDYGVAVAIPHGYVGLLVPRSSTPKKYNIVQPHGCGIIDSDYRGPLLGLFARLQNSAFIRINPQDRIAQLIIVPISKFEADQVEYLPEYKKPSNNTRKKRTRTGGVGSTDE